MHIWTAKNWMQYRASLLWISFCSKVVSEVISEHLISKKFFEGMPPDPLVLHVYAYSPNLPVTQSQLMRPEIGWKASCAVGDFMHSICSCFVFSFFSSFFLFFRKMWFADDMYIRHRCNPPSENLGYGPTNYTERWQNAFSISLVVSVVRDQ